MVTDIYIVRHGNTFDPGDAPRRVGGRTDLPLVEEGRRQAARLGAMFAGQGLQFRRCFVSPLARTRETATIALAATAAPPELETAPFLREIDYGPDENALESDVRARIGEAALAAWERDATPPPGWLVNPEALIADWRGFFETQRGAQGPILVVTSNGVARFALPAAAVEAETIKLATGAYGHFTLSPTSIELRAWNVRPRTAS